MAMEATLMLLRTGAISSELYRTASESAQRLGVKPVEVLLLGRLITPRAMARALARQMRVPCWFSWPAIVIRKESRACIPAHAAAEHRVAPLYREPDGDLVIAMADPADEAAQAEISFFAGCGLRRVTVPAPMASAAVHALYGVETQFASMWRDATAAPDTRRQGAVAAHLGRRARGRLELRP